MVRIGGHADTGKGYLLRGEWFPEFLVLPLSSFFLLFFFFRLGNLATNRFCGKSNLFVRFQAGPLYDAPHQQGAKMM